MIIPRKLDAKTAQKYYIGKFKVYLDNKLIYDVYIYDLDEQFIVRAKKDDKGLFIIQNDTVLTEKLCGVVTVKLIQND